MSSSYSISLIVLSSFSMAYYADDVVRETYVGHVFSIIIPAPFHLTLPSMMYFADVVYPMPLRVAVRPILRDRVHVAVLEAVPVTVDNLPSPHSMKTMNMNPIAIISSFHRQMRNPKRWLINSFINDVLHPLPCYPKPFVVCLSIRNVKRMRFPLRL